MILKDDKVERVAVAIGLSRPNAIKAEFVWRPSKLNPMPPTREAMGCLSKSGFTDFGGDCWRVGRLTADFDSLEALQPAWDLMLVTLAPKWLALRVCGAWQLWTSHQAKSTNVKVFRKTFQMHLADFAKIELRALGLLSMQTGEARQHD